MDDVILIGNDLAEIDHIKQFLNNQFKIKDLGSLKFFLGLELARSNSRISLYQRKYALELVEDAGLLGCKPAPTPMDYTLKLSNTNGSPLANISSYRRFIGRLIYLTTTRPDISYAVNQLSQFLSSPTTIQQRAALRVLKYVKGTPGLGLLFPTNFDMKLKAFSDFDWAGCPNTRRSMTGFSVYLANALISWKSKKQNIVSRSACEA